MKRTSTLIVALAVLLAAVVFVTASASTTQTIRPGDMNGDGKVNSADARIVLRIAAKLEPMPDTVEVVATVAAPSSTTEPTTAPTTAPTSSPTAYNREDYFTTKDNTTSVMYIDPVVDIRLPGLPTDISIDFGDGSGSSIAVIISESRITSQTTPYTGDSIYGHISLEDALDMLSHYNGQ